MEHCLQSIRTGWVRLIRGRLIVEGDQDIIGECPRKGICLKYTNIKNLLFVKVLGNIGTVHSTRFNYSFELEWITQILTDLVQWFYEGAGHEQYLEKVVVAQSSIKKSFIIWLNLYCSTLWDPCPSLFVSRVYLGSTVIYLIYLLIIPFLRNGWFLAK